MINNVKLIRKNYTTLQKELVRKTIHMTVAFVPLLAGVNTSMTITLLYLGIFFYLSSEYLRSQGIVIVSALASVSEVASRDRDNGITLGPVTLGIGALVAVSMFNPIAASCGIYALAFGDGLASLTGKLWGRRKIPFSGGKSFIGSFTCFVMIFSTSFGVTGNFYRSLVAAVGGTVVELIPIKDIDNIIIPLTVAFIISI